MRVGLLCDFCRKVINKYPFNQIQIIKRKNNDCIVDTIIEKDCCMGCSLKMEKIIRQKCKEFEGLEKKLSFEKVLVSAMGNFFSFIFMGLLLLVGACILVFIIIYSMELIFNNPVSLAIICFTIILLFKWER